MWIGLADSWRAKQDWSSYYMKEVAMRGEWLRASLWMYGCHGPDVMRVHKKSWTRGCGMQCFSPFMYYGGTTIDHNLT